METLSIKDLIKQKCGNAFIVHPKFCEEFEEEMCNNSHKHEIVDQLFRRLNFIKDLNMDYGKKWIEHLTQYGNLYSLHIDANSTNYRILYSRNRDGRLLLHVFYEREGKTATSYKKHAPIAIARRDGKQ